MALKKAEDVAIGDWVVIDDIIEDGFFAGGVWKVISLLPKRLRLWKGEGPHRPELQNLVAHQRVLYVLTSATEANEIVRLAANSRRELRELEEKQQEQMQQLLISLSRIP